MYGGMAYVEEQAKSLETTFIAQVVPEMWYFNLFHCINNCSSRGTCYYGIIVSEIIVLFQMPYRLIGFCICYDGYYGEDCSNTSCPGTFCYYNLNILQQECTHACQSGYLHTDNDTYVPDIAKATCSLNSSFKESNGILDYKFKILLFISTLLLFQVSVMVLAVRNAHLHLWARIVASKIANPTALSTDGECLLFNCNFVNIYYLLRAAISLTFSIHY